MEFDTLPLELKNHKIGLLINDYLVYGKSESLINAAKLLAPDTKNFWVALERA